jgi:hypothetical protein
MSLPHVFAVKIMARGAYSRTNPAQHNTQRTRCCLGCQIVVRGPNADLRTILQLRDTKENFARHKQNETALPFAPEKHGFSAPC